MTTLHGCVRHGFMANLRYEWICEVSSSSLKMTMYPLTHKKKKTYGFWENRLPKKNGGFHFLCHNECDGGVGFYWQICKFSGTPQKKPAKLQIVRLWRETPAQESGFESLQGNDCYHSQWICWRENSPERRVVPSNIKNVEVSSKLSL